MIITLNTAAVLHFTDGKLATLDMAPSLYEIMHIVNEVRPDSARKWDNHNVIHYSLVIKSRPTRT